jgi:hypothetical protein
MTATGILVGTLAVWRLTHLLAEEDGPWGVIVHVRRRIGTGPLGQMMDCFYCLSIWISVPLAYWAGTTWLERGILWPALSGAAILLERATLERTSPEQSED